MVGAATVLHRRGGRAVVALCGSAWLVAFPCGTLVGLEPPSGGLLSEIPVATRSRLSLRCACQQGGNSRSGLCASVR